MTSVESGAERLLVKLVKACEQGKVQELEGLLEEAKAAKVLDDNSLRIGLQKASERGREIVVRLLLAEGAKTDVIEKKGLAPLYRAVEKNHLNIVELLLQNGADTECTDRYGRTAFMAAAWRNHDRVLALLIKNGAKVNAQDKDRRTVLHNLAADKLCRWGDEVIHVLLSTDIDVDIEDRLGRTALQWAAVTGKPRLAELLLNRQDGPKPNLRASNSRGKTALHLAAESGQIEIAQLLLDHGANVMAKSDGGWTALHNAADKGFPKVVRILLDHGAEVNATTSSGMTPLHWAAQSGRLDAVKEILADERAHRNPRDAFDSTPLLRAAQYDRQDVVKHLSRYVFKPRLSQDALGALNGFQATIVDFGVGANRSVVKKTTVFEAIYAEDPNDSEKYAVTTLVSSIKPTFRWIHLPANNMRWAEALLTKYFLESGARDVEAFKALERSLVQSHRGPKVHARFMRPNCQRYDVHGRIEVKGDNASVNSRQTAGSTPQNISTPKSKGQDKGGTASPRPKPKDPPREKGNIVLFMPFLHFETDERRHKMSKAIRDALSHDQERPPKPAATYDEMLIRAHIQSSTQLHVRRTLDQFFYHGIDTERRDRDQVVYRFCKEREKEPKIFMVDQLWMWILGDGLIITCFPQRWQQPKNDPLNVLDGLIEDINSKTRPPVRSVYDLANLITGRCCGFFDRHRINDEDYQFLDMFESSIGRVVCLSTFLAINTDEFQTDLETALFRKYKKASGAAAKWLKIKRRPSQFPRSYRRSMAETGYDDYDDHDDDSSNISDENAVPEASDSLFNDNLMDIGREAGLLAECKDIRDELNIIHLILSQQTALLREDIPNTICEDIPDPNRRGDMRRRYREQQKLVDLHIKDIERMDKQAEEIYQHLLRLLDLKQKSANAFEARFARDQASDTARQGQTIMVFTLVTIIFLPMSFMATFFSINISEFPRQNRDGTPGLHIGYVSKYIFGIGLAVSIPLILVAFIVDHIGRAMRGVQRRMSNLLHRSRGEDGAEEEESTSLSGASGMYGLGRRSGDFGLEKVSLDTDRNGFVASPMRRVLTNATERSRRGNRISFQQDLEKG